MQKDQAYHEAAIKYNEGLAEYAETLAPTLGHDEVRRWCIAVGKQHRFHAKRHRLALNKLIMKQEAPPVEVMSDGLDVPEPSENESEKNEKAGTLSDGCHPFHDPKNPNCDFAPKVV